MPHVHAYNKEAIEYDRTRVIDSAEFFSYLCYSVIHVKAKARLSFPEPKVSRVGYY